MTSTLFILNFLCPICLQTRELQLHLIYDSIIMSTNVESRKKSLVPQAIQMLTNSMSPFISYECAKDNGIYLDYQNIADSVNVQSVNTIKSTILTGGKTSIRTLIE